MIARDVYYFAMPISHLFIFKIEIKTVERTDQKETIKVDRTPPTTRRRHTGETRP